MLGIVSGRRIALGAAVVIGAVAIGTAAYALGPSGKSSTASPAAVATPIAVVAPSTSSTTIAPVTTTTLPARPSIIVAASTLNRIVVIDASTGKTTKVLADYGSQGIDNYCNRSGAIYIDTTFGVSLSPDNKTVYFTRSPASVGCNTNTTMEIWKVSVDGGTPVKVVDGTQPVVSPDGTKLAYWENADPSKVDAAMNSSVEIDSYLHVRNLSTGVDTKVQSSPTCGCGANFAWASDSRHMAYQNMTCGCGGQTYEPASVIDTTIKDDKELRSQHPRTTWPHGACSLTYPTATSLPSRAPGTQKQAPLTPFQTSRPVST